MKTKKIWELEDYKGYMPSENDLIPAIDVNGDANTATDYNWNPEDPHAYDNAVTRKLTFGKIKEQMTLMSAKALCNVLGTAMETITGYTPEPAPEPEPNDGENDQEDGPIAPENGLAYLVNHLYTWLENNVIDLNGLYEELIGQIGASDSGPTKSVSSDNAGLRAVKTSIQTMMTKYVNTAYFETLLSTLSTAVKGLENGAFDWLNTLLCTKLLPEPMRENWIISDGNGAFSMSGPVFKSGTKNEQGQFQFDGKESMPMYGRYVWEYVRGAKNRGDGGSSYENLGWEQNYQYTERDNVAAGYKEISTVEWKGCFTNTMYSPLTLNGLATFIEPRRIVGDPESFKAAYVNGDPTAVMSSRYVFCGVGHQTSKGDKIQKRVRMLYKRVGESSDRPTYTTWPMGERIDDADLMLNTRSELSARFFRQFFETENDWNEAHPADEDGKKGEGAGFIDETGMDRKPAAFPAYGMMGQAYLASGTTDINLALDNPQLHLFVSNIDNSKLFVDDTLIQGGYYTVPDNYSDTGMYYYFERAELDAQGNWKFSVYSYDEEYISSPITSWVRNVNDRGVVTTVAFEGEPPVPADYCHEFSVLYPDGVSPKGEVRGPVEIPAGYFMDEATRVYTGNATVSDPVSHYLRDICRITWTNQEETWVPKKEYFWNSKVVILTRQVNKFKELALAGTDGSEDAFKVVDFKWTTNESEPLNREFWSGMLESTITASDLEKYIGQWVSKRFSNKPVSEKPEAGELSYSGDGGTEIIVDAGGGNSDAGMTRSASSGTTDNTEVANNSDLDNTESNN